ncbi:protein TolA [Arenimonas sp. MALMAid1274]|uniref:protein TolA n=1 Tax=Arenimonas sp. MALMAid1274 TaxID=3411630 RepID=UPI003BA2F784
MHADAIRQEVGSDDDLVMPVVMALGLHVALVLLLLLAGWWQPAPTVVSVAGPVVEASLAVTPSDVAAAEKAMEEAPKPEPVDTAPPPQPLPAPQPEVSPEEVQPVPQEQQPEPDTVDQEAVARLALEQEQAREREEQEARQRQEQIDLTEREKQAEAERKQRLREQLEAVRKEQEDAKRRTRMEEQRLQQLADRQPAPQPQPGPPQPPVQAGGNNGVDTDLRAKYVVAMNQTAKANWNRALAPENVACKVRFTQIPGGEVIDVSFVSCGFDAQARESVERALRRTPMPYSGFEPVFARQIDLTFCYPEEACQQ